MKTIAMYLPQFHRTPENDAWWGDGFTDWTAMSKAKPLFEGHKQPRLPLHNYQYDLLKKETFLWQERLMKKYHVYGLCFYHYWFKNGRKILEKPAENLLRWKDIDIPFCFSWANESWGRSWSNLANTNIWASNFETDKVPAGNGILLEQDYGDEEEWVEHFNYFLPFFKDERYIKKENKPLILIHKQEDMFCLEEMCKIWNELAISHGWAGVYIITNYRDGSVKNYVDAMLIAEPGATLGRSFLEKFGDQSRMEVAKYIPYEDICANSLNYVSASDKNVYYGGFSNYDDTPRKGNIGTVIYNDTPEKFKVYLAELYAKNAVYGNEYVFVNAWNEWGEGMHLEPDEEFGYGFLEAVAYAEKHYHEEMYKYALMDRKQKPDEREGQIRRFRQEIAVLDKWLFLQEQGIAIVSWLKAQNYNKVGIYGMGMLGKHLLAQLETGNLEYLCCIDRNAKGLNLNVPVFLPDRVPDLDLLIVTNVHIYEEISKGFNDMSLETVSLELLIKNAMSEKKRDGCAI